MRNHFFAALSVLALGLIVWALLTVGFQPPAQSEISLVEARRDRDAGVISKQASGTPASVPPSDLYRIVRYPTQLGEFVAYLSPDPADKAKHPAIIWIHGGDYNSLEDIWTLENDVDELAAFRKAGIAMMFPSFRGGNDNAGFREGYYGEVDDVLAARDYLAKQEFVDSQRIYLAGHSTGGTLVLLTAEYDGRFRAVFSLAPVSDVRGYGGDAKPPIAKDDKRGFELRSPVYWLKWIKSPVFVFEGDRDPSNLADLRRLARVPRIPLTHFYIVKDTDHRTSVAPVTALIAEKIVADIGQQTNINFDTAELSAL
jgi:acetyl esterase/lipase